MDLQNQDAVDSRVSLATLMDVVVLKQVSVDALDKHYSF